jgi:CRISPR-associated protein Csa3
MKKILLTNTYSFTPMIGGITKVNPDIIYLLIDKKSNDKQKKAIKKLKNTFKYIEFKEFKTGVYNPYNISKDIITLIDKIYNEDTQIYVDLTSGRKTKSIGIMLGCYGRSDKIKDILYFTSEDNKMVYLPKLSFDISKNIHELLELISKKKVSMADLAKLAENSKLHLGRTAVYNNIKYLKDKGYVIENDQNVLELTDFGKLVLL